ncbi:MAG: class I SAM-dependent methyltransferase [Vicinamibacterales bacterium]
MRARWFALLTVLSVCVSLSTGLNAHGTQTPAKPYEPQVGQPGKDVVWVPTPQAVVDKMLDLAKVSPQDVVMDLGSGNGITVISAAKRGATAIGIEFNPDMVEHARGNAATAGVSTTATFVKADLFETDLSKATVITMFLLPSINMKLRPAILDLKPGTRIASNTFTMEDWEADQSETVTGECTSWCTAHYWMVPAKVEGSWQMTPPGTLAISQKFQNITGTLGTSQIANGKLHGAEINFSVGTQRYSGRVDGNSMKGTIMGGSGGTWSATRR